jgi:hypothetical protein
MKWFLIIPVTTCCLFLAWADNKCSLATFKYIALATHNPEQRYRLTLDWLKKNGAGCSKSQLMLIKENEAAMLGAADSLEFRALLDEFLESK